MVVMVVVMVVAVVVMVVAVVVMVAFVALVVASAAVVVVVVVTERAGGAVRVESAVPGAGQMRQKEGDHKC